MPKQYVIIDGYNLMHAVGIARQTYGPGDLERCRHQLLLWLKEHIADQKQSNVTVVFDAIDSPKPGSTVEYFDQIEVRFPNRGIEADAVIEWMVAKHSAPKQVLVVSSDHRLHKAARRRRSQVIDSEDFARMMSHETTRSTSNAAAPEVAKPNPQSVEERNEWLDVFGDISVSEIANEEQGGFTEQESANEARKSTENAEADSNVDGLTPNSA